MKQHQFYNVSHCKNTENCWYVDRTGWSTKSTSRNSDFLR